MFPSENIEFTQHSCWNWWCGGAGRKYNSKKNQFKFIEGYDFFFRSGYNLGKTNAPAQFKYLGASGLNSSNKTMNLDEQDNLQTYMEHFVFKRLTKFMAKPFPGGN